MNAINEQKNLVPVVEASAPETSALDRFIKRMDSVYMKYRNWAMNCLLEELGSGDLDIEDLEENGDFEFATFSIVFPITDTPTEANSPWTFALHRAFPDLHRFTPYRDCEEASRKAMREIHEKWICYIENYKRLMEGIDVSDDENNDSIARISSALFNDFLHLPDEPEATSEEEKETNMDYRIRVPANEVPLYDGRFETETIDGVLYALVPDDKTLFLYAYGDINNMGDYSSEISDAADRFYGADYLTDYVWVDSTYLPDFGPGGPQPFVVRQNGEETEMCIPDTRAEFIYAYINAMQGSDEDMRDAIILSADRIFGTEEENS